MRCLWEPIVWRRASPGAQLNSTNKINMAEATLSAAQAVRTVGEIGQIKADMYPHRIFLSAVSAGCLLAFACGTALVANTSPWMQEHTPGLIRIIASLVFPYGLVMIMITGADLCTASFMVSIGRQSSSKT